MVNDKQSVLSNVMFFTYVRSLQYDNVNCALGMQEGIIDQSFVSLYAYGCKVNCYESYF